MINVFCILVVKVVLEDRDPNPVRDSPLRDSFVWDSSTDNCICNQRQRFIALRDLDLNDPHNYIAPGGMGGWSADPIWMCGQGSIEIRATTVAGAEKGQVLVSHDVYYCPEAPLSLISDEKC